MAQRTQQVDYEGFVRWDEETQHPALRKMSGMCLRLKFIRDSCLPGDEWPRLGCRFQPQLWP